MLKSHFLDPWAHVKGGSGARFLPPLPWASQYLRNPRDPQENPAPLRNRGPSTPPETKVASHVDATPSPFQPFRVSKLFSTSQHSQFLKYSCPQPPPATPRPPLGRRCCPQQPPVVPGPPPCIKLPINRSVVDI